MEDNSPSDEEINDLPLRNKKLKLNDGSSQDSLNDGASASKGASEDNVDSGISADKSESTSSEDRRTVSITAPFTDFLTLAPSSSNDVRAIFLDIRRARHLRNNRRQADRSQDGNSDRSSSRDSDDISVEEERFVPSSDSETSSSNNSATNILSSSSMESSNYSDNSIVDIDLEDDTDSDDATSNDNDENSGNGEPGRTPSVLLKTQPKHNYLIVREVINREMGLAFPRRTAVKENVMFEQNFTGSLHAVYRMTKVDVLAKHKGCVNSLNFHPEGHLLASGSDDTNVIVWDWARSKPLQVLKTGHKSNVFQSKFLHLNSQAQLNIATCARDGQIRLLTCPASGGPGVRRKLGAHSRAAHKLHLTARDPHVVISVGEDALVLRCDVREQHASKLFSVRDDSLSVPLYSVAGHPLRTHELLLAGRDRFLRVYDTRKPDKPTLMYTAMPEKSQTKMRAMDCSMHLTCAVYNHDGTEILGSYNDENIYLFDAEHDVYDKDLVEMKSSYTHKYSGHRNSATFKGVSFFGAHSEFIVSGSDCAHIFIWEKQTEAIVQWMDGDQNGVVNCIEPHPRFPIMATSGLDKDVKIWMPRKQSNPDFDGLEKAVRSNVTVQKSPMFTDFLPSLFSAWRGSVADGDAPPASVEFDGNACTTF